MSLVLLCCLSLAALVAAAPEPEQGLESNQNLQDMMRLYLRLKTLNKRFALGGQGLDKRGSTAYMEQMWADYLLALKAMGRGKRMTPDELEAYYERLYQFMLEIKQIGRGK